MAQRQGLEQRTKIVAGDRRLTIYLMGLWQGLRPDTGGCAPAKEFLATLSEILWADCCVVEIAADGGWQICRVGEVMARRSGVRAASVPVADLPPQSLLAASIRGLKDAHRTGVPILNEGEARDEKGRRTLFRSILLPLGDEQGRVVQYLAGARCRVVLEDA